MLRVYGTLTSPYVRRVRIVAAELGVPMELLHPDAAALYAVTPIWKVPVADLDGRIVLDSRAICEALIARHGWGSLRPEPLLSAGDAAIPEAFDGAVAGANLRSVIDGGLDAAINLFYLVRRDGADPALPYLRKQADRVGSALAWVEQRIQGGAIGVAGGDDGRLGLTEIALLTALDWMAFRATWPVEEHPRLVAFLAAHRGRPSVVASAPTEP